MEFLTYLGNMGHSCTGGFYFLDYFKYLAMIFFQFVIGLKKAHLFNFSVEETRYPRNSDYFETQSESIIKVFLENWIVVKSETFAGADLYGDLYRVFACRSFVNHNLGVGGSDNRLAVLLSDGLNSEYCL